MLIYRPFSFALLLLVVLFAAVMVLLIRFLKKKSRPFVEKFVIIFFIASVVFFMIYKLVLVADEEYAAFKGAPNNIFEELPFNLCNIALWLMPIAILVKKKGLYAFCFFTSFIAAPVALLIPVDGFAGYSIFTPRVMGFILTHLSLFSAWIFLYFLDIYVPRKRDIPAFFLTTIAIAFGAFLINMLFRSIEGCGQPNYFFTAGPENEWMRVVYGWIPIPYVYTLPALAVEALMALGITAIFQLFRKKEDLMELKEKQTWKESHGDAAYIPCGNAYCTDGNCANCEIQMQLQVERKNEAGVELTEAEQMYLEKEK